MLSSSDWQLMCCVVMDDFRDGAERRAVLAQDVLAILRLAELHVHEPLAASEEQEERFEVNKQNSRRRLTHFLCFMQMHVDEKLGFHNNHFKNLI